MKAMQRTLQAKLMIGWTWRNRMGKMTLPTLEPIEAQPMAMGRLVVKCEDMTTIAGM